MAGVRKPPGTSAHSEGSALVHPTAWPELQQLAITPQAFLERQAKVATYLRQHPQPGLVLRLTRNKNDNVVCYAANLQHDNNGKFPTRLVAGSPLRVYWQDIEGVDASQEVPQTALNILEKRLAYGVQATVTNDSGQEAAAVFVAAPDKAMTLHIDPTTRQPRLCTRISGELAVITRLHVNETHHAMHLRPTVHSLLAIGYALTDPTRKLREMWRPSP